MVSSAKFRVGGGERADDGDERRRGERTQGNGDVEARGERADDDDAGTQRTTRGGESGEIFA